MFVVLVRGCCERMWCRQYLCVQLVEPFLIRRFCAGLQELVREAVSQAFKDQEHKDRSVTFSGMDSTAYGELEAALRSAGVSVVPVASPEGGGAPSRGFQWTQATEPQQMDACLTWLAAHIDLPRDKRFVDLRKTQDMLNVATVAAPWLPFHLKGTADVAIVDRACVSSGFVSRGLLVIFEFKKAVADIDGRQAIAEFIAADIHSNFSVVLVLTDLNNTWRFFWADGAIKVTTVGIDTAIDWINLLARTDESGQPAHLAKRQKIVFKKSA